MDMPKPRLPYLQKEKTRHGRINWYVRIGKGKRTRIKAEFGSEEFKEQYHAIIAGEVITKPKDDNNSLKWLIDRYKRSSQWFSYTPGTRKQQDFFFSQMLDKSAHVPYSAIQKHHIINGMDERRNTPAAANNFLKTNRALFSWALESDYIKSNPTRDIKKIRYASEGHLPWDAQEVELFQKRWAIGTRERLAMEILLSTGLRRGDVIRLGKQHRNGNIAKLPASEKTGIDVYISIPDYLDNIIKQSPTGDLAYICTQSGMPRNKEAFGNWFRGACRKAGVSKSAHGLRKTAANLLAEAGGTTKELMAKFGWKSERMATHYTTEADRKKLSERAAKKLNKENIVKIKKSIP